jgi:hypothetical protein
MEQLRVRLIGSEKWKIAILRHYDEKRPNEEVFSISPSGWIYILEYQGQENNKHIYRGTIFHIPNVNVIDMESSEIINYINNKQIEPRYHNYWQMTNAGTDYSQVSVLE